MHYCPFVRETTSDRSNLLKMPEMQTAFPCHNGTMTVPIPQSRNNLTMLGGGHEANIAHEATQYFVNH